MRGVAILSERLKYFRNQNNLTLEQLAEDADISLGFLQAMEAGKKFPGIELFNRIVEILGISPSQLLDDEDIHPPIIQKLGQYSLEDIRLANSVLIAFVSEFQKGKSDFTKNVGLRIKEFRVNAGLSRKDLAAKIDVTVDGLSRIENGINFTTLKTLDAVMESLDIPLEYALQDDFKSATIYVLGDTLSDAKATLTPEQMYTLSSILSKLLPDFDI